MANLSKKLVLPQKILKRKGGIVILPLSKYERIRKKMERLEREKRASREEAEVLRIIAEGEREYKEGKLKPIKSLAELE